MARKTAFVKISGDLSSHEEVVKWLRKITKKYFTTICVGGGTQINEAFAKNGFKFEKHGPLGRETKNFKQRQLARDVLEKNQAQLQDLLAAKNISAAVVIPVLDIGTVICHINGDIFTLAAYHGYDKLYVVTMKSRIKEKQKSLVPYPKIEVVGFSG